MTVYVESNFVLEQALQQEQCDSCSKIIELAAERRINLAIPAFSLAEPHKTITDKKAPRIKLSNELRGQLGELGRSKPHRQLPATFDALVSVLATNDQFEREGLRIAIRELLEVAEIIPLDERIIEAADGIAEIYGMSGQDSIVLASVLAHLVLYEPAESCFLNRNSRDFDDPEIRERLQRMGCKLFFKFDHGLQHIVSRIIELLTPA